MKMQTMILTAAILLFQVNFAQAQSADADMERAGLVRAGNGYYRDPATGQYYRAQENRSSGSLADAAAPEAVVQSKPKPIVIPKNVMKMSQAERVSYAREAIKQYAGREAEFNAKMKAANDKANIIQAAEKKRLASMAAAAAEPASQDAGQPQNAPGEAKTRAWVSPPTKEEKAALRGTLNEVDERQAAIDRLKKASTFLDQAEDCKSSDGKNLMPDARVHLVHSAKLLYNFASVKPDLEEEVKKLQAKATAIFAKAKDEKTSSKKFCAVAEASGERKVRMVDEKQFPNPYRNGELPPKTVIVR